MPNESIARPRDVDKTDPRYFQVLTRGVEALVRKDADGNDRKVIRGIASSTVQDRYGDILTEACQVSMLQQCADLTMWLNHSYKVPEDILGTQTQATLERATDDEGNDCLDLVIEVTIDEENPRAVKSWQHIQNGTKLAFSIGGFFKDYEIQDDDTYWYIFIVNDIDLIEISLVGIPANPRAYTRSLEYATDKIRAEAVKRAESFIAAGTAATRTDARPLVCKSFGLSVEEEKPVEKCAHKDGCEDPRAEDSLMCAKHRDELPIAKTCTEDGCTEPVTEDSQVDKCVAHSHQSALKTCSEDGCSAAVADVPGVIKCGTHRKADLKRLGVDAAAALEFPKLKTCGGKDCAVEGCELHKAIVELAESEPTGEELRDAELVNNQRAAAKAVEDEGQQNAIIECMRCITKAVSHGLCTESATHANTAHAILSALLPDDVDVPDDAQLAAPSPATLDVTATEKELAELKAAFDAHKAEVVTIDSAKQTLSAEIATLSAQKAELEQQIEKLKATPTGRSTLSSHSAGSSGGSEPIAAPELYSKSQTELMRTAARKSGSEPTDARASVA